MWCTLTVAEPCGLVFKGFHSNSLFIIIDLIFMIPWDLHPNCISSSIAPSSHQETNSRTANNTLITLVMLSLSVSLAVGNGQTNRHKFFILINPHCTFYTSLPSHMPQAKSTQICTTLSSLMPYFAPICISFRGLSRPAT